VQHLLVETKQDQHVKRERDVMAMLDSQACIK
jgi:hypothetical protein